MTRESADGTLSHVNGCDIRPAAPEDLPALVRSLGQEEYFTVSLKRQDAGHGFLLVAWQRGVAVGDVYVWLAPAEEPELRTHLRGVALITHLEVVPRLRNLGIGTKLLRAAEDSLYAAGRKRVALGVRLDNDDAQRLYKRQGYEEWPHGEVATTAVVYHADGSREVLPEVCRIMVRRLEEDRPGRWGTS
ncbi:GNAT family N-acetyltransferase [Nonomuraea basaltis]|uniref:GNAT family N-acetyltransferase n=1 Tax=Nonomuraea basaltis TaxID=2495887 RepID=UPI00110C5979|nr:GNAT family N-acetyltransferase [Nonomuraea basaltis]TMR95405.1 GNAT family N-acetyltransferase [Nonomuraea basaltis]